MTRWSSPCRSGSRSPRQRRARPLALLVDELIERCRKLDERILGQSVAILVKEYETASSSDDRQKALMNAAELLDRLMPKIRPWYVRHDQILTTTLSAIGGVSGVIQIVKTVTG